jgi:CheY-like chemotaxis protein
MGDKLNMLLLLFVVVAFVVAGIYFFVLPKGNDVRKIDPANQDRPKSSGASAKPTVAKTAQLSALRERLADAQTSSTGLKKLPAKAAEMARAAEPEKSWRPEDAGLGESNSVVLEPLSQRPVPGKAAIARPIDEVASSVLAHTESVVLPSLKITPAPVVNPAPVIERPVVVEPKLVEPVQPPLVIPKPAPVEAKVHILLVDDSKVVRVKTEKLLLNKGYIVTTAVDGIDALAKLETLRPAIIITDIEMPNLDGFGLVRNVRGNLRTSEIPVIVMTSHVNLHLDIAATEGINGFLPKPFNDQDLLDQVAFLCES